MGVNKLAVGRWFDSCARLATVFCGSTTGFVLAASVVLFWAVSGPFFHYSDTWQLVINTGTTVVTFLMVFLIQRSQNRESQAVQLKLNELIAAVRGASNRLIAIEDLSEEDLRALQLRFQTLSELAKADIKPGLRHSVEECEVPAEACGTEAARTP
ncbi:MAG: low affinity iron permease family protein [Gemmataceae bacterium]